MPPDLIVQGGISVLQQKIGELLHGLDPRKWGGEEGGDFDGPRSPDMNRDGGTTPWGDNDGYTTPYGNQSAWGGNQTSYGNNTSYGQSNVQW